MAGHDLRDDRQPEAATVGGLAGPPAVEDVLPVLRRDAGPGVVDLDPQRYARFTRPALEVASTMRPHRNWVWRRAEGKALSVVRLAKASLTFAGGTDYIVWKINRHAGTNFELKPWQRKHPLLAGLSLLPRLLKSGAVR